jgi:hypothetical protein
MKQQVDNRPNGKPSKKKKKGTKDAETKLKSGKGKMTSAATKELSKLKMPTESILGRTSKKSLRKPGVFTKGA